MTTIKDSEGHLREAQRLLERAGQQYQNPAAMTALTILAGEYRRMHILLAEREAAELAPVQPEPPVAVQDAHGRTWDYVPENGPYGGLYTCGSEGELFGAWRSPQALTAEFGPLRPVGAANR